MLANGVDMSGNKLEGSPSFYLGATVTPEYDPIELQLVKMEKKIKAGAKFFQNPSSIRSFHNGKVQGNDETLKYENTSGNHSLKISRYGKVHEQKYSGDKCSRAFDRQAEK